MAATMTRPGILKAFYQELKALYQENRKNDSKSESNPKHRVPHQYYRKYLEIRFSAASDVISSKTYYCDMQVNFAQLKMENCDNCCFLSANFDKYKFPPD